MKKLTWGFLGAMLVGTAALQFSSDVQLAPLVQAEEFDSTHYGRPAQRKRTMIISRGGKIMRVPVKEQKAPAERPQPAVIYNAAVVNTQASPAFQPRPVQPQRAASVNLSADWQADAGAGSQIRPVAASEFATQTAKSMPAKPAVELDLTATPQELKKYRQQYLPEFESIGATPEFDAETIQPDRVVPAETVPAEPQPALSFSAEPLPTAQTPIVQQPSPEFAPQSPLDTEQSQQATYRLPFDQPQPQPVVNTPMPRQPVAQIATKPAANSMDGARQVGHVVPSQHVSMLAALQSNYTGNVSGVNQTASSRRYEALARSLGQPVIVTGGDGSYVENGSIISGGASCGGNSCGTCSTCCEPCDPDLLFTGTYLYWKASRPVQPYTAVTNGGFDPDMFTLANAVNSDYNYDSGYRFAFAYRLPNPWDIAVRYTHFSTDDTNSITNANFRLLPLQAHPAFVSNSQFTNGLDFARTRIDLDLDYIDLEFGKNFAWPDSVRARPFGGFRWGQIDQSTFTRYQVADNNGNLDLDQILIVTDMEGWGLRGGSELWWDFAPGFSLYSRGGLSLLHAEFKNRRREMLTQGINQTSVGVIDFRNNFEDIVTIAELAVALEYCYRNLRIACGYEFNTWFNVVNDARFVNDTITRREQVIDIDRGSISFQGIFAEATLTF